MFKASPQQQAVIEWVRDGSGSAFVEARAGTGKTTTILHALPHTRGTVALMAFNKSIATEITAKIANKQNPKHEDYDPAFVGLGNRVKVGTVHSYGFGAVRRVYPKVEVDARKKSDRLVAELQIPKKMQGFTLKLVSLAKQSGIGLMRQVDDQGAWYDIIDHHDLLNDVEEPIDGDLGVELAQKTLKRSNEIAGEIIDFNDMCYLPVITGMNVWQNDWVWVDEAQDTNTVRRALARKMLKPDGRSGWVGDRHQAIYGFCGADNDAVDLIIRDFKCRLLPLTVTYRCPKAVVARANEIVPDIQAHETAPEGRVMNIDDAKHLMVEGEYRVSKEDAVLCRKTKPLVQLAFAMIRNSIPCHVEGKDIGAGLIKLVNRFNARTMDQLLEQLEVYRAREVEKLVAKGKETQAENLSDRVETVIVIGEKCQSVDELRTKITDLFKDDNGRNNVCLSTVHKAKGREWGRVFILGANLWMPSKWARQEWQQQQEMNLIYVAVTRAQQELVFVDAQEG